MAVKNEMALNSFRELMNAEGIEICKSSTLEVFEEAGAQMLERGFNVEETITILSGLFAAVEDGHSN